MKLFYSLSILLYSWLVALVSNFNKKAELRHEGVKSTFKILKKNKAKNVIWVHCASLGEFEQGRNLIEKIKKQKPEYQIALSFYSPSGFEVQKNYKQADVIFYLPDDSKKNAKKLIKLLSPEFVFFIKYEFWNFYLKELNNKHIPTYLVSGIFRKNQIFFKFYGGFYRNILKNFTSLFVQNEMSKLLLERININNVIIAGDTRFDRVFEISKKKKEIPLIKEFVDNKFVFIAGSTWEKDEKIIFNYINTKEQEDVKFIIAPHEIKLENINRIKNLSQKKAILFSEANTDNVKDASVLIIDNIGILSSLYFHTDIAYVGGGFGAGIHNTLEAAVFGIPLIFGPKYHKFDEAKELINRKSAFSISNENEFASIVNKLIANNDFRNQAGDRAKKYITENVGASDKILDIIDI